MNDGGAELFDYAELVYEETQHYASWKRQLEELVGFALGSGEATQIYDLVSGRQPR